MFASVGYLSHTYLGRLVLFYLRVVRFRRCEKRLPVVHFGDLTYMLNRRR